MENSLGNNVKDKAAATGSQSLLRADINTLKLKLDKIKADLKQEAKTKAKLRTDALSKIEQISRIEEAIKVETSKYERYEQFSLVLPVL